jgi:cell division initiation protein
MRKALVAAQKMANDIVEEAKGQAEQILREASSDAQTRKSLICGDIAQEEERLNFAKKETARFIAGMRAFIEQEAKLLDRVPDLTVAEAGPKTPAAAKVSEEIGRSVTPPLPANSPRSGGRRAAAGRPAEAPAAPAENRPETCAGDAQPEFDIAVFKEIAGAPVSQDTDPRPKFIFDNFSSAELQPRKRRKNNAQGHNST